MKMLLPYHEVLSPPPRMGYTDRSYLVLRNQRSGSWVEVLEHLAIPRLHAVFGRSVDVLAPRIPDAGLQRAIHKER